MKAGIVFSISAVLMLVFSLVAIAQDTYVPAPNEELYGTWTNEKMFPPKIVVSPGGTWEHYFPASNTFPCGRSSFS